MSCKSDDVTEVHTPGGVLYLCDGIGAERECSIVPALGHGGGALCGVVFEGRGERFPRVASGRRGQGLLLLLCSSTGRRARKALRRALAVTAPRALELRSGRWYAEPDLLPVARRLGSAAVVRLRTAFAATQRLYDALRREHPVDPVREQRLLEQFPTEKAREKELARLCLDAAYPRGVPGDLSDPEHFEHALGAMFDRRFASDAAVPTPFGVRLDERRAFPYRHAALSRAAQHERKHALQLVQGGRA